MILPASIETSVAEVVLVLAQQLAEATDELAPPGRRHETPRQERFAGSGDGGGRLDRSRRPQRRDDLTRDRGPHDEVVALPRREVDAETAADRLEVAADVHEERLLAGSGHYRRAD